MESFSERRGTCFLDRVSPSFCAFVPFYDYENCELLTFISNDFTIYIVLERIYFHFHCSP